jgi:methylated-DNA-[protein]-cysteine S-methyltransferase
MKSKWFYDFPIGTLELAEENGSLCHVFLQDKNDGAAKKQVKDEFENKETPLLKKAASQFAEYFNGKRNKFDVPLYPQGTDFQQAVWKALQNIPYGVTYSYKEVAIQIGNPKACRAVGMANNRNPLMIIIPCHRVIGHDKSLTGYAGGLSVKQYLLDLEKKYAAAF